MKYKIGEFCRLLGVSPDTLRYYEKCGILSTSKDPANKYRSFTKQDTLNIWNLHMLRSLDVKLQDIGTLQKQGSFEAQVKYLHKREKALKAEIEKLTLKRERLIQLSKLYDLVHALDKTYMKDEMSANYALYVMGDECRPSEQTLAEIPVWIACLPFTYFAVEISFKSLMEEDDSLSVRLGLGILEENMQKAGLPHSPEAIYTPKGTMACVALRTRDVFGLTKKDLTSFYANLVQNQLRITGPATGRIICSTCDGENPEFIIAIGAPVEKITLL